MKNSDNSSLKLIGALLVGAAIGGTLGILFAPDKGTETRKKIYKKGENQVDALKDKFNDFLDSITEKFEQTKEDLSEMAEKARTKAEKE